ncbi:MAG: hypothetical protein WCK34_01020 [Bacteroidota bacterium]
MQSKKLKKLITIFFVLFIFSACTKNLIVPDPPAVPVPVVPGQISYAGSIQPIFTAHCITCHKVGGTSPVLVEGKSYQALMNTSGLINTAAPDNSGLYLQMKPGGGMSSFCSKADADSTYKWISQGAKNN